MNAKKRNEGVVDVLSGSVRGIAQVLVGHPFDTMKVRLQVRSAASPQFHGLAHCFSETVRCEGVGGLYRGATSPLAGCVIYSATLFLSWGQSCNVVRKMWNIPREKELVGKQLVAAGTLTGFCASFVESPVDLVKTKLQTQYNQEYFASQALSKGSGAERVQPGTVHYKGFFDCITKLARAGPTTLFQGLSATLMRNIPGSVVYFSSYEMISQRIAKKMDIKKSELPAHLVIFSGGVAGTFFWTAIFPFDVMKSCMQSDKAHKDERLYQSVLHCAQQIYREKGFPGFWRGFVPCILRSFPTNGLSFLAFETAKGLLS